MTKEQASYYAGWMGNPVKFNPLTSINLKKIDMYFLCLGMKDRSCYELKGEDEITELAESLGRKTQIDGEQSSSVTDTGT